MGPMREVRERREELVQRIPRLQLLFTASLVVIGSVYWFVQVVRGDHYRELADNNRTRSEAVPAPRGLILDREGRLLAENAPSYNLTVDSSRSTDPERALAFAAGVLAEPVAELTALVGERSGRPGDQTVLLAENLTLTEVAQIAAVELEFPEFGIEAGHRRLYRHGPQTAHVLGYVSQVSTAELAQLGHQLRSGDLVGKRGVERAFDLALRGGDGERIRIVDSRGRTREQFTREPARAGRDVRLTLDLDLQQEAARYFEGRSGAAVAMDPRTGEILAMVSAPSYDPNLFSHRLDREQWQAVITAPGDPLQNRAVQNTHSPGSVFKIVMAVAGLSVRAIAPSDTVFCSGSTRIYDRQTRCWKRGGHGQVNLRKAIKESCDVYFYHLGQKLGIETIATYARHFGLGSETGFDIPGERAGLVPDAAWSLRARNAPWYPGETVSVSIGQGPILATPVQMATLMAVVANRGEAVTPHVVSDTPSAPRRATPLDPEVLDIVREALWAVVNDQGTGAVARVEGFDIAGKTGTVQVVRQNTWTRSEDLEEQYRDHAWFAAYGPVEDPRLVVVAFVEHGGAGSRAAAPLAKRLYEVYLDHAGAG
jgi:penicillin-binding protein 2